MAITAAMRTQVTQLYVALFGRAPDSDGLGYWVNQMGNGTSLATIAQDMYNTTPARTYYPLYNTNEETVTSFYTNVLGRAPDAEGKAYWAAQLGTKTAGEVIADMITAVTNYAGTDAAATTSKTLFTNKAAVAEYYAVTLQGGATNAAAAISSVTATTDVSTDAAKAAAVVAAGVSTSTGSTYTLTSGADNITGSTGDDNITGALGTLSSVDEIHGGAGADTMTIQFAPELATAGAATAAAPIMSSVETLNITSRSNSAQLDFTDIKDVTTLNVGGSKSLNLLSVPGNLTAVNVNGLSATLTLDQATATASTAAYGLTLNLSASTAASIILDDDTGSTATLDTLTINALNDWTPGSGSSFSGVDQLVLKGAGNITLGMASGVAGGMSADAFDDLTANNTAAGINASGLSGNLTVRLDAAMDINIKGGAGADVFTMTANLNTNDTLDGGAGSDTLNASITGGYLRPVMSNVETVNLVVASAATADMRDVSGVSTLNLMIGSGLVVDKAQTSMSTITVNSSNSTANDLTVRYGTAAVASDVTLNLSNGVQSIFQTAAATATAMALGDISLSGNSGGLTVKVVGTANYGVDSLSAADFTAVALNAASGSVAISANVVLANAQTVTLEAAAGQSLVHSGVFSAMAANTLSFNAAGASALIDLSAVNVGTANTLTITTNSAMSGNLGFSAHEFVFQSAAGATGALSMDTVTINALGGDVAIGSAKFLSGATAVNLAFNVSMGSTAVAVGVSGLQLTDIASGATASEQDVTFNISGTGSFTLSAAAIVSSNATYHINATNLASGSNVTINLASINNVSAVASAAFGAHSGSYVGVDGVDNIEAGLGAMTINGGLGNDVITLNNTAVTRVEFSANATGLAGLDTIIGAGAGDVLLFNGSTTATGATALNSGVLRTGTATNTADIGTSSYTALGSAVANSAANWANIYTSNGDTIIEVWNTTAGTATGFLAGTAVADFVRVTLSNKDFTAITAAFQLNTTGSGLSITLL